MATEGSLIVGGKRRKRKGKKRAAPAPAHLAAATNLPRAKGRRHKHTPGRMNGLERRYAAHLDELKAKGEILEWRFEPFSLRLADSTHYRPDFLVMTRDGFLDIHECKGHWEDDARAKVKIAAEQHPWFGFLAVIRNRKEHRWEYEHFAVEAPTPLKERTHEHVRSQATGLGSAG